MAIVQVSTNDPNFGFIIRKNPASGMQIREIRQGVAFGWYSNGGTSFNIFFKDADNAVSFGDQEFEFLNTTRYNSPVFVLNAMSEYFSSTVKEQIDMDKEGTEKTFMINMMDVKVLSQIMHFEKYFPQFQIDCSLYAAKSYKLTITTTESFHLLFNYINLLALFISLTSDEYIQLDTGSIEKYLNSIERLDAPFFIRYLFNRNMFKTRNQFNQYKKRMETTKLYTSVQMEFGNTAMQRRDKIRKLIPFTRPIVDVGCGEGFYAIPFASNLTNGTLYHAIDIDANLTEHVRSKAKQKDVENIKTYNHIDEFLAAYDRTQSDVILTEVIEHMPLDESRALIQKIIGAIDFDRLVITVPNKDFNQFYMIDDDAFRHPDHKWEPTEAEFRQLIAVEISDTFNVEFINIGDTVNNIATSIGCIVTRG